MAGRGVHMQQAQPPGAPAGSGKPASEDGGWAMRWQIPVLLLAIVGWGAYLVAVRYGQKPPEIDPKDIVALIADEFKHGRYEEVVRNSAGFVSRWPGDPGRPQVDFLAGRATFQLAEAHPETGKAAYTETTTLLGRALTGRLGDNETFEAKRTIALCYERLGEWGEWLRTADELRAKYPDKTRDLVLLQGRAEFRVGRPDEARRLIEDYLRLPNMPDDERLAALLELGEGLRLTGRADDAIGAFRRAIDEYPKSRRVKEAHFGLGLTLMSAREQSPEGLKEARGEFEKTVTVGGIEPDIDRAAEFYTGECRYRAQEYEAAAEKFKALIGDSPDSEEAAAAGIRLAAVQVQKSDYDGARDRLEKVLARVPGGGRLANAYIPSREIESLWDVVLKHYLSKAEYGEATRLSAGTEKLSGRDAYLYQEAVLHRYHAQELRKESVRMKRERLLDEAAEKETQARKSYEQAARCFVKIVNEEITSPLYTKALSYAADCLYEAGDYARAAVYYRLYVDGQPEGPETAPANLRLGLALQAMGRHEEAIIYFEKLSDPGHKGPIWSEASLALATSDVAAGRLADAEIVLVRIVEGDKQATPKNEVWQRALSELGYVFYLRGRFPRAVEKFDEVLERPEVLNVSRLSRLEVVYYLADSWRNIRSMDSAKRREELTAAAAYFGQAAKMAIDERHAEAVQARMIRTSRLAESDCLFELGEYAKALAGYEMTAAKCPDTTDGVTALFRVAACKHELRDLQGEQDALRHARWSLARLKKERPESVSPFHEEFWNALVAWDVK